MMARPLSSDATDRAPGRRGPLPRAAPRVRAGVIHAVAAGVLRLRPDARPLLRAWAFEPESLTDLYAQHPVRDYLRFFEAAAAELGQPDLGLKLSVDFRPEDLGPVGVLFMMAPDLRTALSRLLAFERTWQEGAQMALTLAGGLAALSYRLSDPEMGGRRQDAEFSLAILHHFCRRLLGPRWAPLQVHFEHPAPADAREHRRLFRAPVLFSQGVNEIVFDAADLDRRVGPGDAATAPFIERHLRDLLPPAEDIPIRERVGGLIVSQMGRKPLALGALAEALGMSRRTLQRRLSEEGLTLRDLVRSRRRQLAQAIVEGGRTPLSDLAVSLGYGDASTLSRAFKAWTGQPPRRYARARAPAGL